MTEHRTETDSIGAIEVDGVDVERDGNDITDAFKDYARPLVGDLPKVGSFTELKK